MVVAEVNSFKPGDLILFYNKVNFVRAEGDDLILNLTWHLVVFSMFKF